MRLSLILSLYLYQQTRNPYLGSKDDKQAVLGRAGNVYGIRLYEDENFVAMFSRR